jgi:hypothetical protein
MTCYFPPQDVIEDRFLQMLHSHARPVQMAVMYRALAERFGLSRYECRGAPGDPKGSPWEYVVRQCRNNLVDQGWLCCPEIGTWALTEAGCEEARKRHAMLVEQGADAVVAPMQHVSSPS